MKATKEELKNLSIKINNDATLNSREIGIHNWQIQVAIKKVAEGAEKRMQTEIARIIFMDSIQN